MVGDTRNDIDAATAIGMDSLFVTYGYGSIEGLPESSPGTTIDKFDDLMPLLRGPISHC
jgi:phosphoglycolate phosphatase-like HAD superfamily hydrolase